MRVADIMTREVTTVAPHTAVREAAALLCGNGFTALPVVDGDDMLVGIVTEADVLRDRIPGDPRMLLDRGADQGADQGADPSAGLGADSGFDPGDCPREGGRCPATVAEVMSAPVVALPLGTDVAEVAKVMLSERIRAVPIVDGGRVVGMVTRRDLVRCLARTDAEIATDVRRRLEVYGGADRWTVRVRHGSVEIRDSHEDPVDAHVAKIIARAVPGVEFAKVVAPVDGPARAGTNVPGPLAS